MPKDKKKKIIQRRNAVFIFVFVLLALSVVYAAFMLVQAPDGSLNKGEFEYGKSDYVLMILQCVVGMIIIFLPRRVEQKFNVDIPDSMEIIYFIFLFCAIYLGEVRNFYYKIPFWDMILHAFSAVMLGAMGFVIVDFLNQHDKVAIKLSPFFVCLFAFCFATTCGVLWETYEFTADQLLGTNMQKFITATGEILAGHDAIKDTMKDIIVDMLGALATSVYGYVHLIRAKKKEES